MENNTGKIIRNVAVLDLRSASEAAVANIRRVENVATVIFSPETADLFAKLSISNVASVCKLPKDAKLINGQETITRDSFKGLEAPLDLYVNGQLIIKPDAPEEKLRAGLGSLTINGQLLYPESLAGAIKTKLKEINGQAMAYAADAQFVMGKLTLTEHYLRSLANQSVLLVMGKMDATEILPNELITQKIKSMELMGRATCREENSAVLLPLVKNASRVETIPTGYAYLAQPLLLDATTLASLPGKKLYGSDLRIDPDVSAEALDGAIESLVLTGLLIAPVSLRSTLASKCNLLETESVFYDGELWFIDRETTFHASRFDYVEGKVTLVVRSELFLEEELDPKTLAANLAKVHNWGEIHCTPAQMSALQARLGTNKGEFVHNAQVTDEDENVIGNAAYLAL